MTELDRWTAEAARALGLPADLLGADNGVVLGLAREVAHGVLRPAAPLAAYLLGLAVARGADPAEAAGTITRLARDWSPAPEPD